MTALSEADFAGVFDQPRAKERPTMRDVAGTAGVSLKTVSRVVNDEPGVRPETAARVQAAIKQLGFRRNDMARALRGGQLSRTLGLVIEDVSNPFYSAITRGVEEVMRERGLMLVAGSSDEEPERERELALLLCERRVEGLFIVPAGTDHRYLLPELRLGMIAVFIDRPPGCIEADTVLLDNVGGTRKGVEYLIEQGHRRIGMIGDDSAIFTERERARGFREALHAAGIPVDESIIRLGAHSTGAADEAARELLALPEPPTAVFTGNNRITIGALRALAATGRRVALVGFDDLELAEFLALPVTVITYDPADLGRRAAELLSRRLEGDNRPPQTVILPTNLVMRGFGEV
ncbi:MAG TPA: LacI family DNA-binding transcriptional regulator, partial [Gaiellaceae bacterium]